MNRGGLPIKVLQRVRPHELRRLQSTVRRGNPAAELRFGLVRQGRAAARSQAERPMRCASAVVSPIAMTTRRTASSPADFP
jgi:hypothetical protein